MAYVDPLLVAAEGRDQQVGHWLIFGRGAASRGHGGFLGLRGANFVKGDPPSDIQYAALPWRIGLAGKLEVTLVTSRETRRWVIPKGWPLKGRKPSQAAARKALEEAGLVGRIIGQHPIGSYHYTKRMEPKDLLCEVRVYLLRVEKQLDIWPEKADRLPAWFDAAEAAELVDEGGLSEIIARFASGSYRLIAFKKPRRSSGAR
jgi:8-oxo-dGTP pyrophosphatase MutT (NUDIX family)